MDDEAEGHAPVSGGGRVWGTEERPTVLRKAWWILKGALLTWS